MKVHSNRIKAAAVSILCALVLSGCETDKRASGIQKAERIVRASETTREQETTAFSRPGKPEEVKYKYNEVTKVVTFTWKPAVNAVAYQIKYLDQPVITVSKAECYVTNIEEGAQVTIGIRSVSADDQYSDWFSGTCTIRITVDAPESANYQVDGDYVFFGWKKVENASGYEIKYHVEGTAEEQTRTVQAPKNYINIKLVNGAKVTCLVRAYKVVNGTTIYSDFQTFNFVSPTIAPMNEYSMMTACTLGADRLKEFAKTNGGTLKTSKSTDGYFNVTISFKDEAQHTLKASAKRFLKDIGEAFVESYIEGAKDNAIDTADESDSIKDFIHKLDEAATKNAKMGVLKRIFNRTKVDTDIHCIYQYKYTDLAPKTAKILILKANNKDFAKEFDAAYSKAKQANGYYKLAVKSSQQPFYVRLEQNNSYWILTLYPEHVASLTPTTTTGKT